VDPANNAFERSKIILDLVISSNFEFLLADSLSPAVEVIGCATLPGACL